MADAHHRMKKAGTHMRGLGWIASPKQAAVGLIPVAFSSKSAKLRDAGCAALRYLGATRAANELLSVADRYGDEARAAVDAVLAIDPVDIFPGEDQEAPGLARGSPVSPGRRIDSARGAGGVPRAPRDDALVLDARRALRRNRRRAKERVMRRPSRPLRGDSFSSGSSPAEKGRTTGRCSRSVTSVMTTSPVDLAPLVRAWPGESAHARAVKGLDVLAAIGSDIALMHLAGIANKVRFKGLQKKARERIDQIADARGLTTEELGDRLVPDLDLDDDGSRALSFGARAFKVGFDESLTPFVVDPEGKTRKALPKPNKSDDAAQAKAGGADLEDAQEGRARHRVRSGVSPRACDVRGADLGCGDLPNLPGRAPARDPPRTAAWSWAR